MDQGYHLKIFTLFTTQQADPEEIVLKAIDTLKEALVTTEVRNPSGFLVKAIRNSWIPNEVYEQKLELDCFNEWFPLAIWLALILASIQQDWVLYVITAQQQWILFEQTVTEYPLEKLQQIIRQLDAK